MLILLLFFIIIIIIIIIIINNNLLLDLHVLLLITGHTQQVLMLKLYDTDTVGNRT